MTHELDRAWAQLKRLSKCHYESDFTKGYECGLDHAIQVIERMGGRDPVGREAEADRPIPFVRGADIKLGTPPSLMSDDGGAA